MVRYNTDGSPDLTFGDGASAVFPYSWWYNTSPTTALAVQGDGRIVIGGDFTTINGTPRKGVARLNSAGSVDLTFDPGSGADDLVSAVALQGTNIVIAGYFTAVDGTPQF